jgi:hypothetical protein
MKQKSTIFFGMLFLVGMVFTFSSAQQSEKENWLPLITKSAVEVQYQYDNLTDQSPSIQLRFENNNPYPVKIEWQNEIKFNNEDHVFKGEELNGIQLGTMEKDVFFSIDLSQTSTLAPYLTLEYFKMANLQITKK